MKRFVWLFALITTSVNLDSRPLCADEVPQYVLDIQALQLSSLNGHVFAFQLYHNDPGSLHVSRWWLSSGKSPCGVKFIDSTVPLSFSLESESLVFKPTGTFRQSPTPAWAFSFDGALMADTVNAPPVDGKSFVAIDIPTCLDYFAENTKSTIKVRSSGEPELWHFDYGENLSVEIRLRTPNDALKLGTALRRWEVQSPKSVFGISALTVNSELDLLVGNAKLDLKATDVPQLPDFSAEEMASIGKCVVEGYRAWAALSAVSASNRFPDKRHQRQAIHKLDSEILPDGKFDVSRDWLRRFASLCRQLRIYAAQSPDDTELPIDDPAIRWSRIEQVLEAKLLSATVFVIPDVLQKLPLSLTEHIGFVDAVADLGESQYLKRSEKIFDGEHGDLYRSIFNAHHQHPWTKDDVQRCHEYLQKVPENSPASHCLIESLILMGEIDKISANLADRWYGDAMFAGTRDDQLELLRQLTLVESGRKWLRNRLASIAGALSETDQLALHALRQRATATRTTGYWDFMSQMECDATMTLIEKLEHGE